MTHYINTLGRTTRRIALFATPLLVAATGTAAAHGGGGMTGGGYGTGMMGGWGLFGGGMGLWGLLWMVLLFAVPLYVAYVLLERASGGKDRRPESVLRERYARGELDEEEFERRRDELERSR